MDYDNQNQSSLQFPTTHSSKRPRCTPQICFKGKNDGRPQHECLGLMHLLLRRCGDNPAVNTATECDTNISSSSSSSNRAAGNEEVYTFRLERRMAGSGFAAAGEERIVLFRSDRPGAVGKIVFSVLSGGGGGHHPYRRARAEIHVLEVKEQYRGQDLGGLLFSEAMAALRLRFLEELEADDECSTSEDSRDGSPLQQVSSTFYCCELDVEEDIRRHNKLIHFYEQLGCHLKPNAKIAYLNNNDGECYRKIPMQITVLHQDGRKRQDRASLFMSLLDQKGGFVPMRFVIDSGDGGSSVSVPHFPRTNDRRIQWLVSDNGEGFLQLRTTEGHILVALANGNCAAINEREDGSNDSDVCDDWANFQLLRASNVFQNEFSFDLDEYCDSFDDERSHLLDAWMLLSAHGTFLSLTPDGQRFQCVEDYAVWKSDGTYLRLEQRRWSKHLQPLRLYHQHYTKLLTKQTVPYVQEMRARYLGFKLGAFTLWDALNLVDTLPGLPFTSGGEPSLRTICFYFAEAARKAGHPDWVQLLALIHKLASVVNCLDPETAQDSKDDFDWTISCSSRVVGCPIPDGSLFRDLQSLSYSDETGDESYGTSAGMYRLHCGLNNVLFAWTGPEYMYHMLIHNHVEIPEDGFAMLRSFPLEDWHSRRLYNQLLSEDDHDMQLLVKDFHKFLQAKKRGCEEALEMTRDDCEELWKSHYSHIAVKYKADGSLRW